MMAEAYAKQKNSIGAVCVTAGPGATNALPGLAEAYVDSAPIIIISGQGLSSKQIFSTNGHFIYLLVSINSFSVIWPSSSKSRLSKVL